jgi:hypothetical protein
VPMSRARQAGVNLVFKRQHSFSHYLSQFLRVLMAGDRFDGECVHQPRLGGKMVRSLLNPAATFEYNWHLEMIAQSLKDVANGNCKRLIINVPPRHLKSHSASIAFPAWFLGHFPEKQVACVSYAQDFSDTLARHTFVDFMNDLLIDFAERARTIRSGIRRGLRAVVHVGDFLQSPVRSGIGSSAHISFNDRLRASLLASDRIGVLASAPGHHDSISISR